MILAVTVSGWVLNVCDAQEIVTLFSFVKNVYVIMSFWAWGITWLPHYHTSLFLGVWKWDSLWVLGTPQCFWISFPVPWITVVFVWFMGLHIHNLSSWIGACLSMFFIIFGVGSLSPWVYTITHLYVCLCTHSLICGTLSCYTSAVLSSGNNIGTLHFEFPYLCFNHKIPGLWPYISIHSLKDY